MVLAMIEEYQKNMLESIILDLGDNFFDSDRQIVANILDDVITNALFISKRRKNKENLQLLSLEIKQCVKSLYLQRGTEDVSVLSTSGKNATFSDAFNKLRENIIKNNKRVVF